MLQPEGGTPKGVVESTPEHAAGDLPMLPVAQQKSDPAIVTAEPLGLSKARAAPVARDQETISPLLQRFIMFLFWAGIVGAGLAALALVAFLVKLLTDAVMPHHAPVALGFLMIGEIARFGTPRHSGN